MATFPGTIGAGSAAEPCAMSWTPPPHDAFSQLQNEKPHGMPFVSMCCYRHKGKPIEENIPKQPRSRSQNATHITALHQEGERVDGRVQAKPGHSARLNAATGKDTMLLSSSRGASHVGGADEEKKTAGHGALLYGCHQLQQQPKVNSACPTRPLPSRQSDRGYGNIVQEERGLKKHDGEAFRVRNRARP